MGFWEDNPDLGAGGGAYIGEKEKAALIDNGIVFAINGVSVEEHSKFGERYIVSVNVPSAEGLDGGDRLLSFAKGTVDSRDRTLARMAKYLDDPSNGGVDATLILVGRSQILRPA